MSDEKTATITVEFQVSLERLDDLLTTAIEGGMSNQWCARLFRKDARKRSAESPWYASAFRDGHVMEVVEDSGERDKAKYTLDLNAALEGLSLMSKESPHHFADFLNENEDAITGDVWLQYAVLKELVYG